MIRIILDAGNVIPFRHPSRRLLSFARDPGEGPGVGGNCARWASRSTCFNEALARRPGSGRPLSGQGWHGPEASMRPGREGPGVQRPGQQHADGRRASMRPGREGQERRRSSRRRGTCSRSFNEARARTPGSGRDLRESPPSSGRCFNEARAQRPGNAILYGALKDALTVLQ